MLKQIIPAILFICIHFCTGPTLFSQQAMQDGSFSYSYPIRLPPGRNGMQPNLALVYNSNNGNGICGMGWSLAGLPVVSRDRSYAAKFTNTSPNYLTHHDHFLYAGQRLILKQGTENEYYTENESFQKIKAVYSGDTISYWKVTQKNGTILYFGYTSPDHTSATDGYIEAAGKDGKALLWALSKVKDVHGNYYCITYAEEAGGDYYPVKITYTMGNGVLTFTTVQFYYSSRTDHWPVYIPAKVEVDKRLSWVAVKTGGRLLRKYRIDYEEGNSTGRSRITAITEYGDDGNSPRYSPGESPCIDPDYVPTGNVLPGIHFMWQEGGEGTIDVYTEYKNSFHEHSIVHPGDFNGDGITDVLFWKKTAGRINLYPVRDGEIQPHTDYKMSFHEDSVIHPGNYNGDGTTDVLFWKKTAGRINLHPVKAGEILEHTDYKINFHPDTDIYPGDYNGDGTTDLLFWNKSSGRLHLHPVINGEIQAHTDYKMSFHEDSDIYPGDYNGDGTTDILFWKQTDGRINLYPVRNGEIQAHTDYKMSFHEDSIIHTGDYNGDGMTDLLFWKKKDGRINLYPVRNGEIQAHTDYKMSFHEDSDIHTGDYNGDGITDLFFWKKTDGRINIYPVIGGEIRAHTDYKMGFHADSNIYPGDYNGDGMTDVMFFKISEGRLDLHPITGRIPDILTGIDNGTGGTICVEYTPATQASGAVDPAETAYPYIPYKSPRRLVTMITVQQG